jgi:hypothetical protein
MPWKPWGILQQGVHCGGPNCLLPLTPLLFGFLLFKPPLYSLPQRASAACAVSPRDFSYQLS